MNKRFWVSLILLFQGHMLQAQEFQKVDFTQGIKQLMNHQVDSLSLKSFGYVSVQQFNQEGWEQFNLREQKDLKNGRVLMERFLPIVKKDVIEIRPDLVVVLLHEGSGSKIHVASLKMDGTPIQSFLLHDKFGYLYEKNFRSYSYTEPYHFNQLQNVFEFYQLTYGYDPIPYLNNPTQDPIYHQSFHQLMVNDQGYFELVYSSDDFQETGDIIFRREKQIHAIHEVEFHELSIFTVSDENRPENALWSEKHITYGDMDSHDSIVIHLNYGAKWDRQFFFLEPRDNHHIIKVSQRHENVMMFPGDGTHCELQNWKRYRSSWKDLHSESNFFMTQTYEAEEGQRFPDYLPEELLAAFRSACGSEDIAEEYRNIMSLPHPDHGRVAPTRIIIRVEFSGPLGTGMKYLIFELANSC